MSASDQSQLSYDDSKPTKVNKSNVKQCKMLSNVPYCMPRAKYDRALAMLSAPRPKDVRPSRGAARQSKLQPAPVKSPLEIPADGIPEVGDRVLRRCQRPLQRMLQSTNDDAMVNNYQHTELNAMLDAISACITAEDWRRATELIGIAAKREQTGHSRGVLNRLSITVLMHSPALQGSGLLESFVQGVLVCRDDHEINYFLYQCGLIPACCTPGDMSVEDARNELKDKRRSALLLLGAKREPKGGPKALVQSPGEASVSTHEDTAESDEATEAAEGYRTPRRVRSRAVSIVSSPAKSSAAESLDAERTSPRQQVPSKTNRRAIDDLSAADFDETTVVVRGQHSRRANMTNSDASTSAAGRKRACTRRSTTVEPSPAEESAEHKLNDTRRSASLLFSVKREPTGEPKALTQSPGEASVSKLEDSAENVAAAEAGSCRKSKRVRSRSVSIVSIPATSSAAESSDTECLAADLDETTVANLTNSDAQTSTVGRQRVSTRRSTTVEPSPADLSAEDARLALNEKRRSASLLPSAKRQLPGRAKVMALSPDEVSESKHEDTRGSEGEGYRTPGRVTGRSESIQPSPTKTAAASRTEFEESLAIERTPPRPSPEPLMKSPSRVLKKKRLASNDHSAANLDVTTVVDRGQPSGRANVTNSDASTSAGPRRVSGRRSTTVEPSPAQATPLKSNHNTSSNGDDESGVSNIAASQPSRVVTRRSTMYASSPDMPTKPTTQPSIKKRVQPGRIAIRRSTRHDTTSTDSGEVGAVAVNRAIRRKPKKAPTNAAQSGDCSQRARSDDPIDDVKRTKFGASDESGEIANRYPTCP